MVALLLAFAIGAIVAYAQIDRQSRSNPALANFVPAGLGGFADEQRARLTLATDPAAAESYVKSVVKARPIDVSHLSHLAIWAAEAEQMDLAAQALGEASRRGWRDTFVQVSVLGSAAAEGNLEAATQRLDALARFQAEPAILIRALDIMLTIDGAERNIAAQVSESEYLSDVLVDYASQRPQSGLAVARIIEDMRQFGPPMDCLRRAEIVRSLLQRGDDRAIAIWGSDCSGTEADGIEFTFTDSSSDPFSWFYQTGSGVSARPGSEPGSATFSNRNLLQKLAAWRFLALPPGSHSIRVANSEQAVRTIADRGPAPYDVSVVCIAGSDGSEDMLGRIEGAGRFDFVVPVNCRTQQLRVRVGRGRVNELDLAFD